MMSDTAKLPTDLHRKNTPTPGAFGRAVLARSSVAALLATTAIAGTVFVVGNSAQSAPEAALIEVRPTGARLPEFADLVARAKPAVVGAARIGRRRTAFVAVDINGVGQASADQSDGDAG